jgi:homogentisate 1,2-dioxygenase
MSSPSPPPHSSHLPSQEEGDTEARDPQGPAAAAAAAAAAGPRRGLRYLRGFGNSLESEALPGALPVGRNNPRAVPYGLYAEQVSGTAFTAPRHENRRTWLYRVQPGVVCGLVGEGKGQGENGGDDDKFPRWFGGCDPADCRPCTDPCRWKPLALPPPSSPPSSTPPPSDFCSGMRLVCTSGPDPSISIYMYACADSMQKTHLCNTDGDFLIVPQLSDLRVVTEAGRLDVRPGEICVVPRGVVFQVRVAAAGRGADQSSNNDDEDPPAATARGYVLEVNKGHFALPELGPIVSRALGMRRRMRCLLSLVLSIDCSVASFCSFDRDRTGWRTPATLSTRWRGACRIPTSTGPRTRSCTR